MANRRETMKDREAWCDSVHGVANSWTWPSDWTTTFLMVQLSHPYMTTWKTIALTIWIFVGKVISLLFNTLSKVCHSFPSKGQESFNFMATVTICSDLGAQENKTCHCYHLFPFYLPWRDGTKSHDLSFLNAEFQASFFTLMFHTTEQLNWTFTLIMRLFNSSSLSAIRVVSSAYLKLLIFLLAILIPVCDSSSLSFHTMHFA